MGPNKGILQGWLVIYLLTVGIVTTVALPLLALFWSC